MTGFCRESSVFGDFFVSHRVLFRLRAAYTLFAVCVGRPKSVRVPVLVLFICNVVIVALLSRITLLHSFFGTLFL
jgi:hypothetical protein